MINSKIELDVSEGAAIEMNHRDGPVVCRF